MTDQLKQLSEATTLANRLRGIYAIGPDVGGEPEFGHRDFGSAFTPRIQLEAAERIEALEAQLIEARAQVAVAYEVAAKVCTGDENRPAKFSASALRKMSTADQFAHEQVVLAFRDADEIRALTPAHATTALEQIKQQARDEGKRVKPLTWELIDDRHWGATCQSTGIGMEVRHVSLSFCRVRYGRGEWEPFENRPDAAKKEMERRYTAAILATLSADTQENSDE